MNKENQILKRNKAIELDQFFTKESLATNLFIVLQNYVKKENIQSGIWLEPSAGSGAFYKLMPQNNRLGIDIHPQIEGVIQSDFLEYSLPSHDYITLGNPPFGKNSSLAIKFFNKCANHSQIIAFVVPKTFNKDSVINKLDKNFHLEYSEDLPAYSFELQGKEYDVPCVFQIWRKKTHLRIKNHTVRKHEDFVFCNREEANFAIQRVGFNAGLIKKDISVIAAASHYFIKADQMVLDILSKINWNVVKYNTAGNPSIAKSELIDLYIREKSRQNNIKIG